MKTVKSGFLQKIFDQSVRFDGFTDAWEQRKLGKVADIIGGGTPSTSNAEYWNGDIDWYTPAEIGEEIYVAKSQRTITDLGRMKSSTKILPVGTVLFTSRAGIGNTAILAKEATTNQGFQSIVPHKNVLNSYFIFSRSHELKRYGEVMGAGSTFVEISGKQMSKMPVMIPNIVEQDKIGALFEQFDYAITLHQKKIEKLQELKKAYLQKMFI
ncbi:restriction endonuclease subunit S [Erysipelotrichaceae bacterium MTC7]|nr:restriction endonuclease subunit S [Erysipelotrichaceae bacterium MTC7]